MLPRPDLAHSKSADIRTLKSILLNLTHSDFERRHEDRQPLSTAEDERRLQERIARFVFRRPG